MEITIKKSSIFTLCLAAYYAIQVLSRMRVILFPNAVIFTQVLRFATYLVILILLLRLIQRWDNIKILIISELVMGALFLISYMTGAVSQSDWVSTYRTIAVFYIPLAVAAYNIIDRRELLNDLYIVSLPATLILILTAILSYGSWSSEYDMSLGYIMVFTVLILLAHFVTRYNVLDLILAILLAVFILFCGSRGPFICIISFVVLELVLSKQFRLSRKILITAIILIAAVILLLNYDRIISYIVNLSEDLGFNSRTLRLLLEGEAVSHDSGRDNIWDYYMGLTRSSPIIGHGVMGYWINGVTYPHNIFIEFVFSFGYPVGIVLLAVILVIAFRGVRSADKYDSVVSILFVSYCMCLLVSASYLIMWQFFVCLALCLPQTGKQRAVVQKRRRSGAMVMSGEGRRI